MLLVIFSHTAKKNNMKVLTYILITTIIVNCRFNSLGQGCPPNIPEYSGYATSQGVPPCINPAVTIVGPGPNGYRSEQVAPDVAGDVSVLS